MVGRRVLLLLNGDLREPRVVARLARKADLILCADGGARHAQTIGVVPDFVVGDMDSLPHPRPKAWSRTEYRRDPDENRSDLDKALDFLKGLGRARVFVAGALGGGLDHELVNLSVLEKRAAGRDLVVIGGGAARLLGPGRHRLKLKTGERFSLLAAPSAQVTLTGARYPLKGERLLRGSRGLGNRSLGRTVLLVSRGRVWLVASAWLEVG